MKGWSARRMICAAMMLVLGALGPPVLAQTAAQAPGAAQPQLGDPFDDERVDRSLKALFATGLFADVTLRRDGDVLVIHVVENPIINRIAFRSEEHTSELQSQFH